MIISENLPLHFQKLINNFHKDYPEKFIVRSLCIDSTLPMAKLIIEPTAKQKYDRSRFAKFVKYAKKAS